MKAKSWTITFVLLLGLGGCDGMLEETPDDFLSPQNFYRTATDAEAAIVSAYAPLVATGGFQVHLLRPLIVSPDLGRVRPNEPQARIRRLGTLDISPENQYITAIWGAFYETISRANIVIERVPEIDMDPTRRASIVGEAKFLRALSYFYLVRFWGDVPLITSLEEASAEVARTSKEEVYSLIIQDAQDAAAALPLEWGSSDVGRPAKGAAQALLGDVYLYRHEWQQAADVLEEIINSGVYRLYDDYLHAFLPAFKNGPEHLFSLQFTGEIGPNSVLVRFFYPNELGRNRGGGNSTFLPTELHYESYLPGDYRHDVTFFTEGCNIDGECTTFDPHVYKYRPTSPVPMNFGDTNWPIYRYADVLLMYAETLNELGNTAEAVVYLNMIRARARNGDGSESREQPADYAGPMSQDAVRDAIYRERTWELAYEGKRWFDLKRRGEDYFISELSKDPEATDLEPTDMLWPIPQAEIDLNPNLTQNPGY